MNIDRSKKLDKSLFTQCLGPRELDFVVLHHIAANSIGQVLEMFNEFGVSSHFVIDCDGKIFQLVDENDISYHAGVSFWGGVDGLNKTSIGIEFMNPLPFDKEFTQAQLESGVVLCKYLAAKYAIRAENIVGHSDIAYDKESQLLDRKQDPSHLFNWKFLAENGVGKYLSITIDEEPLFRVGDKCDKIKSIKENLVKFGYRIINLNDEFDLEMQNVARVFNRRFNQKKFDEDSDVWYLSSDIILGFLNGC